VAEGGEFGGKGTVTEREMASLVPTSHHTASGGDSSISDRIFFKDHAGRGKKKPPISQILCPRIKEIGGTCNDRTNEWMNERVSE